MAAVGQARANDSNNPRRGLLGPVPLGEGVLCEGDSPRGARAPGCSTRLQATALFAPPPPPCAIPTFSFCGSCETGKSRGNTGIGSSLRSHWCLEGMLFIFIEKKRHKLQRAAGEERREGTGEPRAEPNRGTRSPCTGGDSREGRTAPLPTSSVHPHALTTPDPPPRCSRKQGLQLWSRRSWGPAPAPPSVSVGTEGVHTIPGARGLHL